MSISSSLKKSLSSSLEPQHVVSKVNPTLIHLEEVRRREEREKERVARNYARLREEQSGQDSLIPFVRYFWHVLSPPKRQLVEGWPLEAIALHLEAITFGDINRLLINVPPGFMKSLMLNVFWPAWEWGPMNMPHLRHLAFSYAQDLTTRGNNTLVKLVTSPQYRALWGDRFTMVKTGEDRPENDQTGFVLATTGVSTGECGDQIRLDHPHNVVKIESNDVMEKTVRLCLAAGARCLRWRTRPAELKYS
jgi:hypothetical protein